MDTPHVVSIHVSPRKAGSPQQVHSVRAVAHAGLEGDRYLVDPPGSRDPKSCDVTLIEVEAIESLERDFGINLAPGDARRNIVLRGVSLDDLVGATFAIGEVTLRGTAISEPCSHLASLTYPEIIRHLAHRAGLEAEILTDGTITAGDPLVVS